MEKDFFQVILKNGEMNEHELGKKEKMYESLSLFNVFSFECLCTTQLSILISSTADLTGLPFFTNFFSRRVLVFLTRFAFRIKKYSNGHLFSKYLTGGGVDVRWRVLCVYFDQNVPKNLRILFQCEFKEKSCATQNLELDQ